MIEGQLPEFSGPEFIEATVSDVGKIHPRPVEKSANHRRPHAGQFRIAIPHPGYILVKRLYGSLKEGFRIGGSMKVPHHRREETP